MAIEIFTENPDAQRKSMRSFGISESSVRVGWGKHDEGTKLRGRTCLPRSEDSQDRIGIDGLRAHAGIASKR